MNNCKLVFAMFFSALIVFFAFGATDASAAENEDYEKALELIEKTNIEIDEKIDAGVEKADALQAGYLSELESKKEEEQRKLAELEAEKAEKAGKFTDEKKVAHENAKFDKKIQREQEKFNALYITLEEKYNQELDEVIEAVFNETLQMSTETIELVKKMGVEAECSWKLVRFADRMVWIDPIRIVGH
ncbi:hypothetical protein [Jeotgalibacillus campisalis]|uniref:OmpH family outer membrane protein n=1 Tax=Jeotgalibacillus campisalis TaxID=220754 RepID=A0A0C2WAL7_9BACL|nr:hypothetical protein [Jeotgalibacillus campisalis]KIL53078.1 hypothetical protein KR50_04070 [Jeotgalibacillus campisalis]